MLLKYFHTLRHLRFVQVAGRILRYFYHPHPVLSPAPELRQRLGQWVYPCRRRASMSGPNRFRFLNDECDLVFPSGWSNVARSRLWIYNLHYFDDLNAEDAEVRHEWHDALIRQWLADNLPAKGPGWEPYPLSLRIVNWVKFALADGYLPPEAVHSLAIQARYLRSTLEYHLLGNHLFANAKALVFAGLFFEGKEADEWRAKGKAILERELGAQILADGGHFELSPMYHGIILEDVLDLINLGRAYQIEPPSTWRNVVARMVRWLQVMSHPDGAIGFFNDAAFGVAPSLGDLTDYASRLKLKYPEDGVVSGLLPDSGYARLTQGAAVLLADVAAVGPDYLPGHAHADSLSFELSLGGRRVLVNSGTSLYGLGGERLRQRGTAAHNTVRLDGEDSSEVWSGFRVARRAKVRIERLELEDGLFLQASHNGYRRLRGAPVHRRCWQMGSDNLLLRDEICGTGVHQVEIYFHVHPSLELQRLGDSNFQVQGKSGEPILSILTDGKMKFNFEPGTWHPEFGVSEPNVCLRGSYSGAVPCDFETMLRWGA